MRAYDIGMVRSMTTRSRHPEDAEGRETFHDYANKLEEELDGGLSQENLFKHRGVLTQYAVCLLSGILL